MSKRRSKEVAEKTAEVKIPLFKYFQLYAKTIHPYKRAYLERRYVGIIKVASEWKKLLENQIKE